MPPDDLRALPDDLREPHVLEWPGLLRLYVRILAVVAGLGLLGGSLVIAWHLIRRVVVP